MGATVRVGTCSFADESLTRYWYPPGMRSGEERLRHYAGVFDTVEIDATYYALPSTELTARWARRTPDGFVFHVKAFGLMTRHAVRSEQLPADLRGAVEVDRAGRVDRPSSEVRAEVFARFHRALEPLRSAGKLGGILMQFPPYVVPEPAAFEYLEWAQRELAGDEMLVEFRHASWLDEARRAETLAFLADRGMTYVVVDSPRLQARNVLPTVVAATSPTAYVRLHGRNAATWNVRGRSAAERFDHLYSEGELAEWVEPLRELASASERAFVLFNNNGRSVTAGGGWIAQAPTNALMLRRLLADRGLPVSQPAQLTL